MAKESYILGDFRAPAGTSMKITATGLDKNFALTFARANLKTNQDDAASRRCCKCREVPGNARSP
jgi:hypothetical protein